MTAREQIRAYIAREAERVLGISVDASTITTPPNPAMGDLALPCFALAKTLGKSPTDIARALAEQIAPSEYIDRLVATGPYVNCFLAHDTFAITVVTDILRAKKKYGTTLLGKHARVLIEYANQNTHKEVHIGHARNFILGAAVANIFDALGFRAVRLSYINDFGSFVPKTLWAYTHHPEAHSMSMGALYAYGAQQEALSETVRAQIRELQRDFQLEQKRDVVALWKKTRAISIKEFRTIYRQLGLRFDATMYESQYVAEGRTIVDELQRKEILKKSEGAIIADLSSYGLDVLVVIRSDGTSQYAVADLAATTAKFRKFRPARAIWVVDVRQSLYFRQLFKLLELMGYRETLTHLGYEFVQLTTGTLASRTGNVLTFQDVRDQLVNKSIVETKQRHPTWKKVRVNRVGERIALAALKFGMVRQHMQKVVTFDIDEALQFQGYTGPYLLYTIARLASVEKKAGTGILKVRSAPGVYAEPEERDIVNRLAQYPELITSLIDSHEPSHIAQYAFDLAQAINTFYHKHPILQANEPQRTARRALMRAARQVLENALGILGIESVQEM